MWYWTGPIGLWLGKQENYWGPKLGNWRTPILTFGFGKRDIGLALRAKEAKYLHRLVVKTKRFTLMHLPSGRQLKLVAPSSGK